MQKLKESKPVYRYKYLKDFQNTVITISGGTVIATLAYLSNLDSMIKHSYFVYTGLALFGISIFIHILVLFLNYIAAGFLYDDFMNAENIAVSGKYDFTSKEARLIGKLMGTLILISLIITPFAFASLFLFVIKNINI